MATDKEIQVAFARLQKLRKLRATLKNEIDNLDGKLDRYLVKRFIPQSEENTRRATGKTSE